MLKRSGEDKKEKNLRPGLHAMRAPEQNPYS
jgi:hypothetical protein